MLGSIGSIAGTAFGGPIGGMLGGGLGSALEGGNFFGGAASSGLGSLFGGLSNLLPSGSGLLDTGSSLFDSLLSPFDSLDNYISGGGIGGWMGQASPVNAPAGTPALGSDAEFNAFDSADFDAISNAGITTTEPSWGEILGAQDWGSLLGSGQQGNQLPPMQQQGMGSMMGLLQKGDQLPFQAPNAIDYIKQLQGYYY